MQNCSHQTRSLIVLLENVVVTIIDLLRLAHTNARTASLCLFVQLMSGLGADWRHTTARVVLIAVLRGAVITIGELSVN